MNDLTIVTGLINLGRGEMGTSFSRSFDHYKECFSKLLTQIKTPMYIYISPDLEEFVWQYRDRSNTTIKFVTQDDLRNQFPFYNQVQKIRTDPEWYNQKSWLAESTQARLELYNPLVMSKFFWLNDAAIMNPHGTKHFLWLDAGLSNSVHHELLGEEFQTKIVDYLEDRVFFLCFPYQAEGEIHGFKAEEMNNYANGTVVNRVARAGLFGGSKEYIHKLNGEYYHYLNDTLYRGYMGTEESIFTLLTYLKPDLCGFERIGENGLIAPWIERMLKKTSKSESRIGIYSLAFNIPKQYQLFIENFKSNYPKEWNNYTKYLINNSTDRSTDGAFDAMCTDYGISQTKREDNIGICGARQLCAEMFDRSPHDYMVFFEEDMMMCGATTPLCKNGFARYYPNLFNKCVTIMEKENLDYLKLSFSEFFGDNHLNWAWHNLPRDKKQEYFPGPQIKGVCNKTKIQYTGSVDGLSYAVGEFHYCNWPVMFSREGSRKVFLETVWAHPFEQTWMSHVHQQITAGNIKAGCLLATPIEHNRVYHYEPGTRKENAG